ncbi:fibronectin-like [Ptychodera flava]|uniref:fibronectin-like n=1 Tax=Ptychodera flava TaxID=63121 RepID=UPI00396A3CB9
MSVYTVSGTGNDDDKLESEPAFEDKRVYPSTVGAFGVNSPDRSTNSIQGSWSIPEGLISSYRIECISSTGDPSTVVALGVSSPDRSTNSIQGSWSIPEGLISSYRIECISSAGGIPHHRENLHPDSTGYSCTGLSAGHLYTMSVYTVSGTGNDDDKLESEPASEDKRAKAFALYFGFFFSRRSKYCYVVKRHFTGKINKFYAGTWTRPNGLISSYRIMCNSSTDGNPHHAEDLNSDITEYTCTGLSAGHLYMMSVYTVSGTGNDDDKLESEPASEDKRVYPYTVVAFGVSSHDRSTNSIQGTWTGPEGLISSYRIECISSTGGNPHLVEDLVSDTTEYNCTGLSAGHLYTMSVYTVSGTGNDDDKLESEPASEDKRVYPEASNILTTATTPDSFVITWAKPDGYWTGYTLTYDPMDNQQNAESGNEEIADPDQSITAHIFRGLFAGTEYSVDIFTISGEDGDVDPFAVILPPKRTEQSHQDQER